jgi:hypothetical protein
VRIASGFLAEGDMDQFVHRKNLELFQRKLAETKDKEQRRVIAKLLADEEMKEPPRSSAEGGS